MASNWLHKYLAMKPEVTKIFDDLEAYLDFCKMEMLPFNEADLYRKSSPTYSAYLNSKKPRRQTNYVRSGKKRNEQNLSH